MRLIIRFLLLQYESGFFEYRKQLDLYKDSLLSVLDTASYRYKINLAQKYLAHGQARSAEKVPLLAIYSSA